MAQDRTKNNSVQPTSSNRGKGYTADDALEHMQALDEKILEALGSGGRAALERICREAPGTYFHSINIIDIMPIRWHRPEHLAAILLHDLGKVHHADAYSENVQGPSSRPDVSILHAHVDGGRTLADYYSLDPLVKQAIEEHHGTLPTQGDEYPYSGRRPRSMFTAMLMIADKAEAITGGGKFSPELMMTIYEDCREREQFSHLDELQLHDYLQLVIEQQDERQLDPSRPRIGALDRLHVEERDHLHVPSGLAHESSQIVQQQPDHEKAESSKLNPEYKSPGSE